LIDGLCLVDIVYIEAPDGTMFEKQPESLAMVGPSNSVFMAKVRSQHLFPFAKKESRSSDGLRRAAREKYKQPREWTVVHTYATVGRTQLDEEDINYDMYNRANHYETELYASTDTSAGQHCLQWSCHNLMIRRILIHRRMSMNPGMTMIHMQMMCYNW
jgi:hypothetical protein